MIIDTFIIHKIAIYANDRNIVKILLYHTEYGKLIKSSISHYDDLIIKYGGWNNKNDLKSIISLHKLKIPIILKSNIHLIDDAARKNDFELVKFLHYNTFICVDIHGKLYDTHLKATFNATDFAAEIGNLEIVRFLQEKRRDGFSEYALQKAGQNNHRKIVNYLREIKQIRYMFHFYEISKIGPYYEKLTQKKIC